MTGNLIANGGFAEGTEGWTPDWRCDHCGRLKSEAVRAGAFMCAPPYTRQLHEFTGRHPHDQLTSSSASRALTDDEVAELDSYGKLSGRAMMPARAAELWEREIFYGRKTPDPRSPANGLINIADRAK